jgi:hypothetical protein
MKKLSAKHKKILKAILIPLAIILVIAMINEIVKYIIISKNDDIIIYRHRSPYFLFLVTKIDNSNELTIQICNYHGRGFLLLDDPFYESRESIPIPWNAVYEKISIPEDYNINPNNILIDKKIGGLARKFVFPDEKQKLGLSEYEIDFYTCEHNNLPQILFINDGRKFVVYKKFNYLFLKEIKEEEISGIELSPMEF